MTPPASAPTGDFYGELAPFYDAFTRHPRYASWIVRLEQLARRHGLRGRRALDVGCGTGKSFLPLLERGYRVTACDPSAAMLEAARRKRTRARLHVAGLPDLPVLGEFDYVTCVNDVVNYVEPEDLPRALRALAANMAPRAVLLFDASTTAMYRSLFARSEQRKAGAAAFAWRGRAGAGFRAGGRAAGTLAVRDRSREEPRTVVLHDSQRHHPEPLVARAIAASGLRLEAVYGQCDDGRPVRPLLPDLHTKALFLARKLP